ncbi:MAG: TRAM domain-containing protein [bacterium]
MINEVGTDFLLGYTENMKQIIVKGKASPGDFVQVKITRGVPFKLYGEII